MNPRFWIVAFLLQSAAFGAQSVAIGGLVGNILGQPLAGVGIRLAAGGLSATSDASGRWNIVGEVGIASPARSRVREVSQARLELVNGNLQVRYGRLDGAGRGLVFPQSRPFAVLARAAADSAGVDTLLYSWNGVVVDKQPLMAWDRTDLKEYIDTTGVGAAVVPGPSGVAMAHPLALADYPKYIAGMKKIPARNRTFLMGLKDSLEEYDFLAQPQHPVSFSYDWYMDSTGVTAREYGRVLTWAIAQGLAEVRTDPRGIRDLYSTTDSIVPLASLIPYSGGTNGRFLAWNQKSAVLEAPSAQNYPMINGTWYGAVFYANMKSRMAGLEPVYDLRDWTIDYQKNGYRLPTEAEWEYSARSGTQTRYYWGDSATYIDKYAIVSGYWSVADARPNAYGLYDMVGNGAEWCNDRGGRFPSADRQVDPIGPARDGSLYDSTKVFRGASGARIGVRAYTYITLVNNFRLVLPIR